MLLCFSTFAEAMTPGTYSTTIYSMKGDMTVQVTVDSEKITDIKVTDTADTVQIVGAVIENLIPEIIAKQSLNVDRVSGATFSSLFLKNAVKTCLEQAEADTKKEFSTKYSSTPVQGKDQKASTVIVGSGGAGLSTAIQLAKAGFKDVIVLEKNGYFGGTTGLSSGGAWVVGGTDFNKMTGFDYSPDELVKHMYAASGAKEGTLNNALIRNIAKVAPKIFTEYANEGAPWDLTRFTFGDSLNEMPVAWAKEYYSTTWSNGSGITLINWLVEKARENGVELRLNSKVTDLVVDKEGAVKGVKVSGKDEIYMLYADNVVLATGGFQNNRTLVQELTPKTAKAVPFTGAGSNGDGIVMARELGAYVVGDRVGGVRGLDMRFGYAGPIGALVFAAGPIVNKEGLRYAPETEHYSYVFNHLLEQTDATVYGITDSSSSMLEYLEKAVKLGYVAKADTLKELGEALKLSDVDAFVKTVGQYNSDYEKGADDSVFGVKHEAMKPVNKAPFYGIKTKATSSFSLAGLAVDENCRILRKDGSVIPNLFGAGDLICGNITGGECYSGSGSQVGPSLYEGKIIANAIAAK